MQDNHYYPYGMTMDYLGGLTLGGLDNPFKYQGKELQEDAFDIEGDAGKNIHLDLYDFHARQYDPQLGRWHVPDPLNQHVSPYLAMGNNPISVIDPDGKDDKPEGAARLAAMELIPYFNVMPPRVYPSEVDAMVSIGCLQVISPGVTWNIVDGTCSWIGITTATLSIPDFSGYGGGGLPGPASGNNGGAGSGGGGSSAGGGGGGYSAGMSNANPNTEIGVGPYKVKVPKRPHIKSQSGRGFKSHPQGGGGAASQAGFVGLTVGQIVFNEIAAPIVLAEPTPFGEAILGAINLGFLIYNNPPTLQMSRGKPKMQGGGQNQRDRGFKGYPEDFKKWAGHGQKGKGEPDLTTQEIQELYKQWILEGRPKLFK